MTTMKKIMKDNIWGDDEENNTDLTNAAANYDDHDHQEKQQVF